MIQATSLLVTRALLLVAHSYTSSFWLLVVMPPLLVAMPLLRVVMPLLNSQLPAVVSGSSSAGSAPASLVPPAHRRIHRLGRSEATATDSPSFREAWSDLL